MSRFPRHRWTPLLRLPALAMLMLAVLVNPVLAAIGDLHETSHVGAAHAQSEEAHDHVAGADAHDDKAASQEQDVDFLHALMHAAHCCGHLTAILSGVYVSHAPLFSSSVSVPAVAAPHSPPRTDPFRPPIAI